MSALQGKELADLTVETLENMRNESDFKLLHEKITMYAKKISAILEPAVPRKRKGRIIQFYSMLKEVLSHLRKLITLTMHMITLRLFITKLLILSSMQLKKDLINQHLKCMLKQNSYF